MQQRSTEHDRTTVIMVISTVNMEKIIPVKIAIPGAGLPDTPDVDAGDNPGSSDFTQFICTRQMRDVKRHLLRPGEVEISLDMFRTFQQYRRNDTFIGLHAETGENKTR